MWFRVGVLLSTLAIVACAKKAPSPVDLPEIAPSRLTRAASSDHIQKRPPLSTKTKE